MAVFRLLHASDLHLAQTPYWAGTPANAWLARRTRGWRQVSHDPAVLDAFARWVWVHGGFAPAAGGLRFDALLLTGDLATTGGRADLREARGFVDDAPLGATYRTPAGKPTIAFTNDYHLINLLPGNHDRYRSALVGYLPGGRTFDAVFCPGAGNGRPYWCAKQGFAFAGGPRRGAAAVLIWTVDFSLRVKDRGRRHYGLPGWLGQGRVSRHILYGRNGSAAAPAPASLVGQTRAWSQHASGQGLTPVVVWAIHFDPYSTDALLRLLDSDLLAAAAAAAGVDAVLCGHTHESKVKPLSARTTVFACGATAAAHEAHNDFQVLEIEAPGAGGQAPTFRATWHRYDPPPWGTGEFRPLMTVTR